MLRSGGNDVLSCMLSENGAAFTHTEDSAEAPSWIRGFPGLGIFALYAA